MQIFDRLHGLRLHLIGDHDDGEAFPAAARMTGVFPSDVSFSSDANSARVRVRVSRSHAILDAANDATEPFALNYFKLLHGQERDIFSFA